MPIDFDWPIGQTWLGYAVSVTFPECPTCRVDDQKCGACFHRYTHSDGYSEKARDIKAGLRSGTIPWPDDIGKWDAYKALHVIAAERGLSDADLLCPRCEGHGDLATPELREWAENQPETPIPDGEGWQLWETVGDSPMSPVFATSAELVEWMITNPWMMGDRGNVPSDRATAEKFIEARWAPSMISTSDAMGTTVVDGVSWVTSR